MKQKDDTQYVTFRMKPPKFMVGDIAFSHGFICVVNACYPYDVDYSYELKVQQGGSLGKICQEDIKEVPLTPEILEKNEWREGVLKTGEQCYIDGWLYLSQTDEKHWQLGHGDHYLTTIECVHQLQHLLFGLGFGSDVIV